MNIYEYQAKEIFRQYGIPVPAGKSAFDADRAVAVARNLEAKRWVVKVQVHAGARNKTGGVRFADSNDEIAAFAARTIGGRFYSPQTGRDGKLVKCVLVEEALAVKNEYYLGLSPDYRAGFGILVTASRAGGSDIEATARENPGLIVRRSIDIDTGLRPYAAVAVAEAVGLPSRLVPRFVDCLANLYRLFCENDCVLAEINPLAETEDGELCALDAKVVFDDNALSRHPGILGLRDVLEENSREAEAIGLGINYVSMDGTIGCLVNGAGLAMATADLIGSCGGSAANFLDVGGTASERQIADGIRVILLDKNVRGLLFNIFGGITDCEVIARGLLEASRQTPISLPIVMRLEGTNFRKGFELVEQSGLRVHWAADMEDAVSRIVELVKR